MRSALSTMQVEIVIACSGGHNDSSYNALLTLIFRCILRLRLFFCAVALHLKDIWFIFVWRCLCAHICDDICMYQEHTEKIDGESFSEMSTISSPLVEIGWRIDFPSILLKTETQLNYIDAERKESLSISTMFTNSVDWKQNNTNVPACSIDFQCQWFYLLHPNIWLFAKNLQPNRIIAKA